MMPSLSRVRKFALHAIFLDHRYSLPIGYEFNAGVDHDALLQSFLRTGFQATNFGRAVEEIDRMVCGPPHLLMLVVA